jgi:hypothetical protein
MGLLIGISIRLNYVAPFLTTITVAEQACLKALFSPAATYRINKSKQSRLARPLSSLPELDVYGTTYPYHTAKNKKSKRNRSVYPHDKHCHLVNKAAE